MKHYCTYFDSGYLAQGVALWRSLTRHDSDAILWVLALDAVAGRVLRRIGDASLRVVDLAELLNADSELAKRQTRPRAEFIFAITPCLLLHLLQGDRHIEEIVYLDADLYFFGSPEPIWADLRGGSILVVPHRFPSWHDDSARYGRFNVGVLAFRRDEHASHCIAWWRERCLESTELVGDGVRFGDQKYLDEWSRRFPNVMEIRHCGINVAPWNWAALRFDLGPDEGVEVNGEALVVYHFAQFKRVSGHWFDSGQLEYGIMPRRLRSRLYGRYWEALVEAEKMIAVVEPGFGIARRGWRQSLQPWHVGLLRLACGQFWWRCGPHWLSGRAGLGRFSGRMLAAWRRWQRRRR